MELYLPIILTTASTLIVLIVGWALKLLGAYIASKTENENVKNAFGTLQELVTVNVSAIEQEFRKKLEDGVLTDEEKSDLKKMALDRINNQMPVFIKTHLEKGVADLDSFVNSKIEETVLNMKK